jgi:heme-degrading monooxygenase HmoA
MPALPWISSRAVEPDRDYLVLASELPLFQFRATPGFLRMVLKIRRQLAGAPGLVRYSLDARRSARRYWTLSVWEDRDALSRFRGREPARGGDDQAAAAHGRDRFTTWQLKDAELPAC